MNFNYKLFFKYLFLSNKQVFFQNKTLNNNRIFLYLLSKNQYFTALHIKLSTFFYSTQLIDLFVYEVPTKSNLKLKKNNFFKKTTDSVLVYNFHTLLNSQRFFFFIKTTDLYKNFFLSKKNQNIITISEIFLNANWLEREVAELHGFFFYGKKDIRNLMLQYGDTSSPMKKSYPSIGLREIAYDSVTDSLVQTPTSIQF